MKSFTASPSKAVALIKPDISADYIRTRPRPPLSLLVISSLLESRDIRNDVFDLSACNLSIDAGNYSHAVLTSTPLDRWETPYLDYRSTGTCAAFLKERNPGITVLLTGTHGTVTPEAVYADCPAVDAIIRGEPEDPLAEYFSGRQPQTIHGFYFRGHNNSVVDNGIAHTADINLLPLPNHKKIDMTAYSYPIIGTGKAFTVETSRGCPFACNFCLKAMFPVKTSFRNVDSVLNEVEILTGSFGIEILYFQDLEFTLDKNRVLSLCDGLVKMRSRVRWGCASRVSDVDDEILAHMKAAGCASISFGVESLCQKTLDRIRKGIVVSDIARAEALCRKHGIYFNLFVTRYFFETDADIIETYRNAFRYGIHYTRNPDPIVAYPGTKLYQELFPGASPDWKKSAESLQAARVHMPLKAWMYFLLMRCKLLFRRKTH